MFYKVVRVMPNGELRSFIVPLVSKFSTIYKPNKVIHIKSFIHAVKDYKDILWKILNEAEVFGIDKLDIWECKIGYPICTNYFDGISYIDSLRNKYEYDKIVFRLNECFNQNVNYNYLPDYEDTAIVSSIKLIRRIITYIYTNSEYSIYTK